MKLWIIGRGDRAEVEYTRGVNSTRETSLTFVRPIKGLQPGNQSRNPLKADFWIRQVMKICFLVLLPSFNIIPSIIQKILIRHSKCDRSEILS